MREERLVAVGILYDVSCRRASGTVRSMPGVNLGGRFINLPQIYPMHHKERPIWSRGKLPYRLA